MARTAHDGKPSFHSPFSVIPANAGIQLLLYGRRPAIGSDSELAHAKTRRRRKTRRDRGHYSSSFPPFDVAQDKLQREPKTTVGQSRFSSSRLTFLLRAFA